MKIITLKGKPNSGKTTTITNIFEKLRGCGAVVQYFERTGADNKDFLAFITYNGKEIVFCSIGDIADEGHSPLEYVLNGMIFASKKEADIFINAFSEGLPVSFETYKLLFSKEDSLKPILMAVRKTSKEYENQKVKITEDILNEIN